MTPDEAIAMLKAGKVEEWNEWREIGEPIPNLSRADFRRADLTNANLGGANLNRANLRRAWFRRADLTNANLGGTDLRKADLGGANLKGAKLRGANLKGANLEGAELSKANLSRAWLRRANLTDANLEGADLSKADLRRADFRRADLIDANLGEADLSKADLGGANLKGAALRGAILIRTDLDGANLFSVKCGQTHFADLNLSVAKGLELAQHLGQSYVSNHTLEKSQGDIPAEFLRGCGFRPWEIQLAKLYRPELRSKYSENIASELRSELFASCLISYSHEDSKFVDVLGKKLDGEGVSFRLDKHDGSAQKNVARVSSINEIVVIVLSEHSLASPWLSNEVKGFLGKERKPGSRFIFLEVAIDDTFPLEVPMLEYHGAHFFKGFSNWPNGDFDEQFEELVAWMKERL